jgi:hypothetical protein
MPYTEFRMWQEYFDRYPPEWRADYRASVIAKSMSGGKAEDMFPSLKRIRKNSSEDKGLRGSMFFSKMLNSKGGDRPDFLKD